LSAQLRVVTLFDRRKEGVHVNVDGHVFIIRQCDSPERCAGLNLGVSKFCANCRSDTGLVWRCADVECIECAHWYNAPDARTRHAPLRGQRRCERARARHDGRADGGRCTWMDRPLQRLLRCNPVAATPIFVTKFIPPEIGLVTSKW